jgi:hypothetical protein
MRSGLSSYLHASAHVGPSSHLVIQALLQITSKIFIRSQSSFLASLHNSAIPGSPNVSQNRMLSRFCPLTWVVFPEC